MINLLCQISQDSKFKTIEDDNSYLLIEGVITLSLKSPYIKYFPPNISLLVVTTLFVFKTILYPNYIKRDLLIRLYLIFNTCIIF